MAIYATHYYEELLDGEPINLVDIDYYCSTMCRADHLVHIEADLTEIGRVFGVETDYDIHCAACLEHIQHGLQCGPDPASCTQQDESEDG